MKKKIENKKLLHVKKGEMVRVLTGNDKGKVGIIKEVYKSQNKIKVEGINIQTKHVRQERSRTNEKREGRKVKIEALIDVSNVCKHEE